LSFSNFDLQKDFINSIEEAGYTEPTPLQAELIPLVAEKKNVLIWTQSASGKTGAFLIPAMNYILENPNPEKRGARILILTSRRDRVSQINYTIKRLSSNHTMRFGFVVSGRPYQTQMRLMRRPLDIMIATPGRLNDLMNNGKADFSQLEMLIVDDLTSIYKKNLQGLVEKIIHQAGPSCSTMVFAHDDQHVTSYARELLNDATELNFENEPSEKQKPKHSHEPQSKEPQEKQITTPDKHEKPVKQNKPEPQVIQVDINELMPQKVHVADDYTHKIAMMDHLMDEYAGEKTLIYTSTNKVAKTLLENLSNHGHAAEMLQDLSPDEINDSDILIYTDQDKAHLTPEIMAESELNIIHFDLPRKTDQYLKRLQNHAAIKEKESLLMVDGYNFNELKHLEKTFGETLEQITVPGLEPLNPFVNQSKRRSSSNQNQQSNQRPNQKAKRNNNPRNKNNSRNARNKNPRNARNNNTGSNDNQNSSNQKNSNGKQQTRQRKGPFGRTNGGGRANGGRNNGTANNNNNNRNRKPTVGVSRRGTQAPNNDRAWESDFAEPQERKAESKAVVISYKKRSFSMEKPDSDDS
jgi:superfamily II DNA/RNA helicase